MPTAPRIFISAGELSGDFHGSHLVREIRKQSPDAQFFGVGSHNMADAGVKLLFESSGWGGIGIYQNLRHLPMVNAAGRKLLSVIPSMNPNLVIVIDYRVFHAALLKGLVHIQAKKLYYFAPVVWPGAILKPLGKAYSDFLQNLKGINPFLGKHSMNRFEALGKLADKLIVAYPFALNDYKNAGADVEFLGHPLMNVINADKSRDVVRNELGIGKDTKLIGIFPGSRDHEINVHLPVLARVMSKLVSEIKDVVFYIPLAHPDYQRQIIKILKSNKFLNWERWRPTGIDKQLLKNAGGTPALPVVIFTGNEDYNIFAASDLALSKTGTSVQILMALGVPTVAFYTVVSSLWYNFTKRYILDFEHIAFPNIIAGRRIIPEFVQDEFTVSNLLIAALNLINDDARRNLMSTELLEIRNQLHHPDALQRSASIALELCERKGWRKS